MDKETQAHIETAMKNELSEYFVYTKLAECCYQGKNKQVLTDIANDELAHYKLWKGHLKKDIRPSVWKIWKYYLIARIFGLTFGIKLMEKGEEKAQGSYEKLAASFSDAEKIIQDENRHEKELTSLIEEEKLKYVGSIVLGLNDALVELTGTLAGLTFALQNTRLIALAGLITGIAASLSMSASEYLSTKSEGSSQSPFKASFYTGLAYIFTVIFLILPYLLLKNYMLCLGITIAVAILIILVFNYYISVAKDLDFKKRFVEMAGISIGVAVLTFFIGYLIRIVWGIEV